jgi:hypothetical protein
MNNKGMSNVRFGKKEFAVLIGGTLLALAGIGVSDPWIFFPCFGGSWLAFIWLCILHEGKRLWRSIVGIIITASLSLIGWRAYHAAQRNDSVLQVLLHSSISPTPQSEQVARLQTVHDLFQNDFPSLLKYDSETEFVDGKNNTKTKIKFRVYQDFEGRSKFVSFYIPSSASTFDACRLMADAIQGFLDEADKVKIGSLSPGTSAYEWSKDLVFTKKVFVYYESDLTLEQQGQLDSLYKSKGFLIQFRGQGYATTRFLQSRAK